MIRTHPGDTGIRITVVSAYKYALDTAESQFDEDPLLYIKNTPVQTRNDVM